MDSQTPLRLEPVQPIIPPTPGQVSAPAVPLAEIPTSSHSAAPPVTPPPAPLLPAAPKPQPLAPATPPIVPLEPPSEPPEPAQAPRSRWTIIFLGITFAVLAIFVAILIWQRVAPRSAPVLPDYIPGQAENLPSGGQENDSGISEDSPEMCTLDAMECPDGTMVGRSGPDCAFICPDGQSYGGTESEASLYESLDDTSEGFSSSDNGTEDTDADTTTENSDNNFSLPEDEREDLEFDNTYHNPTYQITYKFPTVLDVRDTKPYPRSDILFRHGFFDTGINIDDGYVEASTLPLGELVEKTKQEYANFTVVELADATYNGDTWKHYAFVQGILTHEHIFIERGSQTFHLWSSGLSYRIGHFAEDIRFTN